MIGNWFSLGGGVRSWIFRVLVLLAGGLMVYSFLQPWWFTEIYELRKVVAEVYPYGLWYDPAAIGIFTNQVEAQNMPAWFTSVMWVYFGIAVAAILVGLFIKSKGFTIGKLRIGVPNLIIGIVGFSYIVVALAAVYMISTKTAALFDTPFRGFFYLDLGGGMASGGQSDILIGYWLACAAGALLLVLALVRNLIVGKDR